MTREEFAQLAVKRLRIKYPFCYRTTWKDHEKIRKQTLGTGVGSTSSNFEPGWIRITSDHKIAIGRYGDLEGVVIWQEWDNNDPSQPFSGVYEDYTNYDAHLFQELCSVLVQDMLLFELANI
ncbi:MAG: hypothetical protein AB7L09_02315 [Nitrospira sp.]